MYQNPRQKNPSKQRQFPKKFKKTKAGQRWQFRGRLWQIAVQRQQVDLQAAVETHQHWMWCTTNAVVAFREATNIHDAWIYSNSETITLLDLGMNSEMCFLHMIPRTFNAMGLSVLLQLLFCITCFHLRHALYPLVYHCYRVSLLWKRWGHASGHIRFNTNVDRCMAPWTSFLYCVCTACLIFWMCYWFLTFGETASKY